MSIIAHAPARERSLYSSISTDRVSRDVATCILSIPSRASASRRASQQNLRQTDGKADTHSKHTIRCTEPREEPMSPAYGGSVCLKTACDHQVRITRMCVGCDRVRVGVVKHMLVSVIVLSIVIEGVTRTGSKVVPERDQHILMKMYRYPYNTSPVSQTVQLA